MGQVEPALWCFNGVGSFPVLHFFYCVIIPLIDDSFFAGFSVGHIIDQGPAYAATLAGFNEAVLWTGI